MVKARLDSDEGSDPIYRAIVELCTFIYDEIEKTRRMAIRNMREILRKSKNGEELRAEINNYLSFNIFTREVADLLSSSSDADWWKIADKVSSSNDAVQLLGQVRRQRENDADHPGLLVLQGLATAATPNPHPGEAAELLVLGLMSYARSPLHDAREIQRVGRETMARLATLAPQTVPAIARSIVKRYQLTSDAKDQMVLESLVRGAHPWIHKCAANTDLDRAAAVPALQEIAKNVRQAVRVHLETDA